MKRYAEAIEAGRRESALNPQSTNPRDNVALAMFYSGKEKDGVSLLEELVEQNPGEAVVCADLGWAYGRSGQPEKARAVLDRMRAMSATRFISPRLLAIVASGLNDRDLALAQLERAFELRDPYLPTIGNDPAFDPIRTDPRFRDLLKRLKLDVYFPETPSK